MEESTASCYVTNNKRPKMNHGCEDLNTVNKTAQKMLISQLAILENNKPSQKSLLFMEFFEAFPPFWNSIPGTYGMDLEINMTFNDAITMWRWITSTSYKRAVEVEKGILVCSSDAPTGKCHGRRGSLRNGSRRKCKGGDESKFIEEIVKGISEKLSYIFSRESNGLVGIDDSVGSIESLLAIESREVRMIGIWGMGGIGKTTIAG
ncbi:hypothetical protein PIB30_056673 [Stylosanthes scabra]|uniref:NB-ARC domain-containing protein n=1 Tax=Stylosanthes scabra TaxID=79078 RepID=A0ABU6XHS0_9FABA|nr:hypothetical protein [Stylosanthes scabra]